MKSAKELSTTHNYVKIYFIIIFYVLQLNSIELLKAFVFKNVTTSCRFDDTSDSRACKRYLFLINYLSKR